MTMQACYDLSRCPPTFDVVAFLALLEQERLARDEEFVDIYILPGPAEGFRRDNLWPRTVEARRHLRDNVLVPLCHLLPSVRGVYVASDRSPVGWGKGDYLVGLPNIVRALRAGFRPLRSPRRTTWQRVITFTLREAEHHPLRNSRTEEWFAAARMLEDKGHRVVVVRDTIRAADALVTPQSIASMQAATDLLARADLYASALLNVGISNGPMWMSIFMNAPTLMLRPTTNEAHGCYDDHFFSRNSIKRGDQLPASPFYQRLVWQEDTCETIVRAVEDMLALAA